jgi:hypothetical protein
VPTAGPFFGEAHHPGDDDAVCTYRGKDAQRILEQSYGVMAMRIMRARRHGLCCA